MPVGAVPERAGEPGDEDFVRGRVGLQVQRLYLEDPVLAVSLGVEPADEGPAVQDRERVVSVAALGGRGVDLDLVVEPEEFGRPRPVPDHGVEGREQGRARGLQPAGGGDLGQRGVVGMDVGRLVPAFYLGTQ